MSPLERWALWIGIGLTLGMLVSRAVRAWRERRR